MPRFRITAEVKATYVVEIVSDDERTVHDTVLSQGPRWLVDGPFSPDGEWEFGDVSVHRMGHGFDRAKVKNLISRLSDEDADAIVRISEKAYQHGLDGLEIDEAPLETVSEVRGLEGRLSLASSEIFEIYTDAHEAGFRDGGHADEEDS